MEETSNPFEIFASWFAAAEASEPADPNAMCLATATADGRPSARIVLLKAWDERGFVFYTNRTSRKGAELAENPRAHLLFHWKSLERQVRIEGPVTTVSDAEADAYFATRPRESQLGAWASEQSRPMTSRTAFLERLEAMRARFGESPVPRPEFWTGFRLAPENFEFWEARPFRLHERRRFERTADGWAGAWLFP